MRNENFNLISATVGYGKFGVNEVVNGNYTQQCPVDRGDVLHCHAPSVVNIDFKNEVYIQGCLNKDVNPKKPVDFYVNGENLGTLVNNCNSTRTKLVQGECTLEAFTSNPACAHSMWRVVPSSEIKPKKIGVCTCLFRDTDTKEFVERENYVNASFNDVEFYIDCDKKLSDVATRINSQIQKAINDGCDVIVVIDPNVVVDMRFVESLTTENEYVVEGISQGVSLESYNNNKYKISYDLVGVSSVIAATPKKWIEIGGFKLLDEDVSKNIENIIENESFVVKYNIVFPQVVFAEGQKKHVITSVDQYVCLTEKQTGELNVKEEKQDSCPEVKGQSKKRKVKKNEKADVDD